jgi:hypothetical protein
MRALLAAATTLLLTASLAGCFERRGALVVDVEAGDTSDIDDFQSLPVTFKDLRIKAATLNPETFPAAVGRVDLRVAEQGGQLTELFRQDVRADRYQKIEITTTAPTFQGILRDGTSVAVVVEHNGVFIALTDFEVPRGGAATYVVSLAVVKTDTGTGQPTYTISVDPAGSRIA